MLFLRLQFQRTPFYLIMVALAIFIIDQNFILIFFFKTNVFLLIRKIQDENLFKDILRMFSVSIIGFNKKHMYNTFFGIIFDL